MNETRIMDFVGKAVEDVGALLGGAIVVIGNKLGQYRAMAGSGTPFHLVLEAKPKERT
jgi:hypothetical protein